MDYKFIYNDIGCKGRILDGGVLKKCILYYALENKTINIPKKVNTTWIKAGISICYQCQWRITTEKLHHEATESAKSNTKTEDVQFSFQLCLKGHGKHLWHSLKPISNLHESNDVLYLAAVWNILYSFEQIFNKFRISEVNRFACMDDVNSVTTPSFLHLSLSLAYSIRIHLMFFCTLSTTHTKHVLKHIHTRTYIP